MQIFTSIVTVCSGISVIIGLIVLLVRPLRERLTGMRQVKDGQRCLLRNDMLGTYYKHKDSRTVRQYEYENFLMEYAAYKALGGNSFVDDIAAQVRTWTVET